jgi:hypothetical protein
MVVSQVLEVGYVGKIYMNVKYCKNPEILKCTTSKIKKIHLKIMFISVIKNSNYKKLSKKLFKKFPDYRNLCTGISHFQSV